MDEPSHSSAKKHLPISYIWAEQSSGEGVSCNAFSHDVSPSLAQLSLLSVKIRHA